MTHNTPMPATKREKPSNELTESKLDTHRAKLGQIFTTPSGQSVTPAKLNVMQVDIIDAIQQVVLPNGKRRKVTDSAFRACIADLERYVEVAQKQRGREWMEACVCQVNSDDAPLRVPAMLADKARLREAQREQAKGVVLARKCDYTRASRLGDEKRAGSERAAGEGQNGATGWQRWRVDGLVDGHRLIYFLVVAWGLTMYTTKIKTRHSLVLTFASMLPEPLTKNTPVANKIKVKRKMARS